MSEFDLKKCLACFSEAHSERYEQAKSDLPALEKVLSPLRRGGPIRWEHLEEILDEKYWQFGKFINLPSESIKKHLPTTDGLIAKLAEGVGEEEEREIIYRLDDIFKDMVWVSLVLRFAVPESYYIYTPPIVQNPLVHGPSEPLSHREAYLRYLRHMRSLKQRYGFERVADVDMALWAYLELCYRRRAHPECDNYRSTLGPDLVKIVVGQLVSEGREDEAVKLLEGKVEEFMEDQELLDYAVDIFLIFDRKRQATVYALQLARLLGKQHMFEEILSKIEKWKKDLPDIDHMPEFLEILEDVYGIKDDIHNLTECLYRMGEIYASDGNQRMVDRIREKFSLLGLDVDEYDRRTKQALKKARNALRVCKKHIKEARIRGLKYEQIEDKNECDFCGIEIEEIEEIRRKLKGKVCGIVGGYEHLRNDYIRSLKSLGYKEVLWASAVERFDRIDGVVDGSDHVVIITGCAKHAGTWKAEGRAKSQGKPIVRISKPRTGVRGVVEEVSEWVLKEL